MIYTAFRHASCAKPCEREICFSFSILMGRISASLFSLYQCLKEPNYNQYIEFPVAMIILANNKIKWWEINIYVLCLGKKSGSNINEMFGCRYEDEPVEPEIEVRSHFCFLEEYDELNFYGLFFSFIKTVD
jgi:hypothetical protein